MSLKTTALVSALVLGFKTSYPYVHGLQDLETRSAL
jgi:hypothetical protein